jgi:hypothetical protein
MAPLRFNSKLSIVTIAVCIKASAFPAPSLPLQPLSNSATVRFYLMSVGYHYLF